jgi:hypothetical protein
MRGWTYLRICGWRRALFAGLTIGFPFVVWALAIVTDCGRVAACAVRWR